MIRVAQPVVKVNVEPLPLDAIHDLLEERLGDHVAPSLSGRIHMKSGGLPGFAVTFADAGKRRGTIRKQGSVWHDSPDLWSDELEGAFESLLYRYPQHTREALEMLVLTGPIDVEQAAGLIGQEELEKLEGRGLVRLLSAGGQPLVMVNPPGISDYFRHQPKSVRGVRLKQRIEAVLGDDAVLEWDGHVYENGAIADLIPQPEVPLLARAFRDRFELDLAHTWQAWKRDKTLMPAIRALDLRLTGESPAGQIERIIDGTDTSGAEGMYALYYRYLHARWLVTQEVSLDQIEAVLQGEGDLGHPAAIEALIIGFRAERIAITQEALTRIAELAEMPGLDGQVAGLVHVAMHALGGQPSLALEQIEALEQEADRSWVARFAAPLRGLALVTGGSPNAAFEWASSQLTLAREAYDRAAMVAQAYIAVMSLLTMSRYADATAAGSIVAGGQFQAANLLFGPDKALMNALATAALRSGRAGSVETLIERGASYHGRSDAVPMGAEGYPAALMTEIDEEPAVTSALYRELAEGLTERGYEFSAAGSLMLAILLEFDLTIALVQREKLLKMGATVFLAYLDAQIASHGQDAASLVEAARWLRREQANESALTHLTSAVRMYRAEGKEDEAQRVREEIADLMASDQSVSAASAARVESSIGFTQREREIIDLVAKGLSNPQIAETLSLSVRTVETHLRNIRRKSGALERDEIGDYSKLR
ncbi:helix-turn-helix transcriptional regulator [Leucobacter sp. UCMA 4100]|uniref:helix-turn-helix transcriptional regulator n=1 Tax=Leucobacter sp. UCMA 4100 TaxID=2810534 RepID=UPI0022EA5408|nr:LuxR family transcriptional regulator [Leucobacter sp. UCMA 4100]